MHMYEANSGRAYVDVEHLVVVGVALGDGIGGCRDERVVVGNVC